jgi:hypothetical protein
MSDHSGPPSRVPSRPLAMVAALGLWVLGLARIAVDGGTRSSPGYNRPKRYEPCPQCGKKVRVKAGGWGYCRNCREEFNFNVK